MTPEGLPADVRTQMAKEIAKLVAPVYSRFGPQELEQKFQSALVKESPGYQIIYGAWLRGTNARVLVIPVAWCDPKLRYASVGNYTGPPLFFEGLPPELEAERYRKLKSEKGPFDW